MTQKAGRAFVVSDASEIVRALVGLKDVRVLHYARRGAEVELVIEQTGPISAGTGLVVPPGVGNHSGLRVGRVLAVG